MAADRSPRTCVPKLMHRITRWRGWRGSRLGTVQAFNFTSNHLCERLPMHRFSLFKASLSLERRWRGCHSRDVLTDIRHIPCLQAVAAAAALRGTPPPRRRCGQWLGGAIR